MKPKYLLHFFFVFLVLLNNCHSKYFKYDEDHWNHILTSLNHKEGRLPPYIRSTTSRSSFKDINLTKEFEEVHKNMNYYSSIEGNFL